MQPQSSPNPVPTPPTNTQPQAQAASPANEAADAPAVDSAVPAMADDGDLIEKEWVHKVKQVVRATVHDPYEQNRKFNKLKADYMQKRYGKRIKLD